MESVAKMPTARHSAIKHAQANVLAMVHTRLHKTGHAEFRNLDCEHDSGTLWLRGQLPSYYLKQLVQESLRHMDGVDRIVNAVEVL